jgi:nucleoside phosphorylase
MRVAVAAAMLEELAPLRARLGRAQRIAADRVDVASGWLAGRPVIMTATGDGERNAHQGARALLAAAPSACLIVLGVAGALSPGLEPGALVVAERVVDATGAALHPDATLAARAAAATGAHLGVVVTADRVADTAAEKRRLLEESAAGRAAAVVDLESAAYGAVACEIGIPWLVLRAVSDRADEALPSLLNRARIAGGAISRPRVVMSLLANPFALSKLLGMRARIQYCAQILAAAVESVLNADPFSAGGEARTAGRASTLPGF